MDVESLQTTGRRRTSCLNVFLVVSIITLFLAVAALTLFVMMELRTKDAAPQYQQLMSQQPGDEVYKMGNFASLEVDTSELDNSTVPWTKFNYGNGSSVGRMYNFNEEQSYLQPLQEGSYFIFLELNLWCTSQCKEGLLEVHIGNALHCEVKLEADKRSVSKKCWTVTQIHKEKLSTQMTISKEREQMKNWTLNSTSKMGMFLVD